MHAFEDIVGSHQRQIIEFFCVLFSGSCPVFVGFVLLFYFMEKLAGDLRVVFAWFFGGCFVGFLFAD